MIFDSLSLAVEGIVLDTVEAGVLSACKSALDSLADSWRTQLRCEALGRKE